jgi:hypothetical protein
MTDNNGPANVESNHDWLTPPDHAHDAAKTSTFEDAVTNPAGADYPDFSSDQPSIGDIPVATESPTTRLAHCETPVRQDPLSSYGEPAVAIQPDQRDTPRTWADRPAPAPDPYATPQYTQYQPYPTSNVQPYSPGYPQPWQLTTDHPSATPALILGILGLCGLSILAPIAWYLSARARKEIAANPGRWNSGSVNVGYALGIIGTVLWAIAVSFITLMIIIGIASR